MNDTELRGIKKVKYRGMHEFYQWLFAPPFPSHPFLRQGTVVVPVTAYTRPMNLPYFERDDTDIDDLWVEAEMGNIQAQFEFGYMLFFGLCVRKCKAEGLTWLFRASIAGHAKAQAQIAEHYLFGEDAFVTSSGPAEAIKWLCLSARQGEPQALHYLSYCYSHGHGFLRNEEQALAFLYQAAHLGFCDSQFQLARLYQEGIGVTRNFEQAHSWFVAAADGGCAT